MAMFNSYVSHNQRVSSHLIQLIQGPDSMSWHRSSSEGIAQRPSQGIADPRASVVSIKTHSQLKTGFIWIYLGNSAKISASLVGQPGSANGLWVTFRRFKSCPQTTGALWLNPRRLKPFQAALVASTHVPTVSEPHSWENQCGCVWKCWENP